MQSLLIGLGIFLFMQFINKRLEKNLERLQKETASAQWGVLIGHVSLTVGIIYVLGRGALAILS